MQASKQDTERLHQQASAYYLQGQFNAALNVWRQILVAHPGDERAREGLRLCELLTEEGATESEPHVAAFADGGGEFEVPELEIDLPDLSAQAQEAAIPEVDVEFEPPADGVAGTASSELQKRIEDLMREAVEAYRRGDGDTARNVLVRVFILDETHADALLLQEQIESGVPAPTEFVDVADLDAPEHNAAPGEFDLTSDDPEVAEPDVENETAAHEGIEGLQLAGIETDPVASIDDIALEPLPEFDAGVDPLEGPEARPKRIRLPQLDAASSKTRWIVIGVVLGIVAVAGISFWMKLGDTTIRDDVSAPVATSVLPPLEQPAEAAPAKEPAGAADIEAPSAVPTEDVDTLLARGRKAIEGHEYAAAIVAFHSVLEQQPAHVEAVESLAAATQSYKLQQEHEKQWLAAIALFRDGEYPSSMRMLYRLPTDGPDEVARLDRYKENGWYNMGLQALRSGDCATGRSHIEEAKQLDPDDPDIVTALTLCDSCEAGSRKIGFQRAVKAISLRGLDD